jgi:putative transposase
VIVSFAFALAGFALGWLALAWLPALLAPAHRALFRCYWRWRSRRRTGRPRIDPDLIALIARISTKNPLWGAPRIHGELLKLGFRLAQSTVSKYMIRRSSGRNSGWDA